ncbi:hypothetical protein FG167_14875 [Lacinutrix sp. WUR7]|uniref:hypothetical protein n=1 Tax=Lacinutrix sp. WUR7 TaxID=2653681 RepID=UPI00193E4C4E|nr:hypothetical protein [Lacinutrix sp. WUR7]QRM90460.1 hypothetical protein FG167_14875 [Lacinutrix sp. WUR7]
MFSFKKHLPLLFLLLAIALSSCDGRDKKHRTTQQDLIENKALDTFSDVVTYFPEKYTQVVTDTILSNGFEVKINTSTDMKNSVLNAFKVDTTNHKHYYRDLISKIEVSKNGQIILSEVIGKPFFLKFDNTLEDYFKISNLTGVWLDEKSALTKDEIFIYILFNKPETDYSYLYKMIINNQGEYSIKEIEEVD